MIEKTSTADVAQMRSALRALDAEVTDTERVDQLRVLEELKSAVAAAQARVTVAFAASQRAAQEAAGVPAAEVGTGIGAQVALARRDSPHKGSRHLGLAQALVGEMPHTLAALEAGRISEWRATILVKETACLSRDDRGRVDAELAARPGGLTAMGDAQAEREARRVAYRLDPASAVRRHRKAVGERRVTIRPAPDTMTYLTGLLPAAQGVAVYSALTKHADSLRSQGDQRTKGQIMADTLIERCTGQATAEGVAVEVSLVMSQATLLEDGAEPAELNGYGPVPAGLARRLLAASDVAVWVRRLFARPADGRLVAMESTRQSFPAGLRAFIEVRDQSCRRPWCNAPIRHTDHVTARHDGGETRETNGQGLCEACNYTKEALGWLSRPGPDGTIETTTPTGHTYHSHAPPPVGAPPPLSQMERHFLDYNLAC